MIIGLCVGVVLCLCWCGYLMWTLAKFGVRVQLIVENWHKAERVLQEKLSKACGAVEECERLSNEAKGHAGTALANMRGSERMVRMFREGLSKANIK